MLNSAAFLSECETLQFESRFIRKFPSNNDGILKNQPCTLFFEFKLNSLSDNGSSLLFQILLMSSLRTAMTIAHFLHRKFARLVDLTFPPLNTAHEGESQL